MTRVLVWSGGTNPFANLPAFVAHVKTKYPGISDKGLSQIVKRSLDLYDPGHSRKVVHLFGADILTADLESIPAWPYIAPGEQQRLRDHPHDRGERVDEDNVKVSQLELARSLNRQAVHRSALISPRGLQQTYVWSTATNWQQEVTDHDYDLILATPGQRRLFRDLEVSGPYAPIRSYDVYPVVSRHAGNAGTLNDFIKDRTRTPQWAGTDLK